MNSLSGDDKSSSRALRQSQNPPRVSILMAVRGPAPWIESALHSVLAQTFKDWQLIVALDGPDPRLQDQISRTIPSTMLVHLPAESGAAACRNAALELSATDITAVLDSDDCWSPDHLEFLINRLNSDPGIHLVGSAATLIDSFGREVGHRKNRFTRLSRPLLLAKNVFVHSGVMFRRDSALASGGYDSRLAIGEDYALWLKLAHRGLVKTYTKQTVFYRIHEHQTSQRLMDPESQRIIGEKRLLLAQQVGVPRFGALVLHRVWSARQARRSVGRYERRSSRQSNGS